MADTTTPNYALVLIQIGGSRDTWGTKFNGNLTAIDTALKGIADQVANKASAASVTAVALLGALKTVDGAGSGLDADMLDGQSSEYFAPASAVTAAALLAKLLTVDGTGSGLDADTLDGRDSADFAAAAHNHDGTYLQLTGGALTGLLTKQGEGVFPHFAAAGMSNGTITLAAASGADPTSKPGDMWLGY